MGMRAVENNFAKILAQNCEDVPVENKLLKIFGDNWADTVNKMLGDDKYYFGIFFDGTPDSSWSCIIHDLIKETILDIKMGADACEFVSILSTKVREEIDILCEFYT